MDAQWQKVSDQAMEHIRGAARFRWWALLVAWLVCAIGWGIVASLPSLFAAEARVYINARTALAPALQGMTINQDIYAQISLVRQSLLGTAQLERIVQEAGLDGNATTPAARAALVDKMRESTWLNASDSGAGMIFQIGHSSADRDTSLKVVEVLLNTFVNETLGGKRTSEETTQTFLQEQIKEYEQRLRADELRLAEFKRRNVGQMPGAEGDYFTRLQSQMQTVEQVRSRLTIAQTRRDELRRQLQSGQSGAMAAGLLADDGSPTGIAIKQAEARLQELLLQYTDKWPEVVTTRETLERLRERQQRELALQTGDNALSAGANSNPMMQRTQLALNDAEVELASLRTELADSERSVAALRGLVNVVPEVEAELLRLNRDYDLTRGIYNELVARLDKANLGQEAESTDSIKFEIINPPTADFEPALPNRPRLAWMVLIGGLGAGAGVAWVLHMLRPVFHSSGSLQEITGYSVLGVVSMTWLDRYRRRQLVSYAAFGVGLLGLGGMLVIFLRLQSAMPLFQISA